jgi:putative transcriptional regulator
MKASKKKNDLKVSMRGLEGIADPRDVKNWNDYAAGKTKKPKGFTTITVETPSAAQVKEFRKQMAMTQNLMARAMNTSSRSVQQWEQGQRSVSGPAAMLMKIFGEHPEIIEKIMSA